MSSAAYATPLRLELRPSRRLAAGMAVVHVCAALIPWTQTLHPLLALFASAAVLLAAARAWRLHLGDRAIASVLWDADDRWHFRRRDGRTERGRLLPQGYLHPDFAVLRYALDPACQESPPRRWSRLVSGRRVLVLASDSGDADGLRRLRVRLKLEEEQRGKVKEERLKVKEGRKV